MAFNPHGVLVRSRVAGICFAAFAFAAAAANGQNQSDSDKPVEQSRAVLEQRPFLGLGVDDSDNRLVINIVVPGFPGHTAGIQQNDIVVSVDGLNVSTVAALSAAVENHRLGDKVTFVVRRGEDTIHKTMTFVRSPAPGLNSFFDVLDLAVKSHDSAKLADCFSDDADIMNEIGDLFEGQSQIREFLEAASLTLALPPERLRIVNSDTVIMNGSCRWKEKVGRYTIVCGVSENHWSIQALRLVLCGHK